MRRQEVLATEEPLEIRFVVDGRPRPFTVTMRTPGADFELVAGLLHGEGLVAGRRDLRRLSYCTDPEVDEAQQFNIVNVVPAPGAEVDLAPVTRNVLTTSACGICGAASLEALALRGLVPLPAGGGPVLTGTVLASLPDRLRRSQPLFDATGGLHAAGLFTADGDEVVVREDVGRHNAVDKVVGWALLADRLPLRDHVLVVSGRAGYEIAQKAVAAGIAVVVAVSAPSSLAVALADRFGLTLAGFVRGDRANLYTHPERVQA
ncbi:formate dehydrogenase accessory sulfurtransferase FdhD [soil metagenome]